MKNNNRSVATIAAEAGPYPEVDGGGGGTACPNLPTGRSIYKISPLYIFLWHRGGWVGGGVGYRQPTPRIYVPVI